ncbi:carbohydrate ABC transporter permease [Bradyrhizobium sp. 2TAF24]|uniref:carbohydrate ABC transporter permease n=1 Tax=Bradyrhizobium sp. 2TAF24 TaxID=3233011 RepID=UPI003F93BAE6
MTQTIATDRRRRPARLRWWRAPEGAALQPYLYLAPLIVTLAAFTFWPLLQTVLLSVQSWNLNPDIPRQFVGLQNYRDVLTSSLFGAALVNTALYLLGAIPLKVVLPIPVAIFIWSLGRRGEIYRVIVFLPTLISFVAAAVVWAWLLSPLGGYLAVCLELVGIRTVGLLSNADTALWTILGIATWKVFGFHVLLYLSGLSRIDHSLVEAMRIDGASDARIVRDLILPMLGPSIVLVLVTTTIFTMQQVFTPIDVLTKGGPSNSTTNLFYTTYQYSFVNFNVGHGAAATVMLFMLVFVVVVVKFRLIDRRVHYKD